eukprot:CAMPEP_0196144336 /NCGR_PEP_ID=MMETSP0910-20130528/15965_1 /TAXON_ID=49265 /ORGANISM="Thalassiosira rotula, Strain GSO102" /LENGTH=139 /DNA_ID=CAMNT_0041405963 /DNA_START=31 /DNA_END=453 /DNA_ORIENTATION=+
MNSFEVPSQITLSSKSSSSVLAPQMSTISLSPRASSPFPQHELDCSGFNGMTPSPSLVSAPDHSLSSRNCKPKMHHERTSSGMISGWGSALSRSRCANNLASLGSSRSSRSGNSTSTRQIPPYGTGPNEGWGYFADTQS